MTRRAITTLLRVFNSWFERIDSRVKCTLPALSENPVTQVANTSGAFKFSMNGISWTAPPPPFADWAIAINSRKDFDNGRAVAADKAEQAAAGIAAVEDTD